MKNSIDSRKFWVVLILGIFLVYPLTANAQDDVLGLAKDIRGRLETAQRNYIRLLQDSENKAGTEVQKARNEMESLQRQLDGLLGNGEISEEVVDTGAARVVEAAGSTVKNTIGGVTDKIRNFIDSFKGGLEKAKSTAGQSIRRGAVNAIHELIRKEQYDAAVTLSEKSLETARKLNDNEAIEEFGAAHAFALFKAGRVDEAKEALELHNSEKLPAVEKRINDALTGTSFDPGFKTLLDSAKAINGAETKKVQTYGRKPGFFTMFNPFYQVSRIKTYLSKNEFAKKMDTTLSTAYKKVATAREKVKLAGNNRAYNLELAQAEKEYNGLAALATDFADNPGTRIAEDEVNLFDPSNLFATASQTLYSNTDDVFGSIETAIGTKTEDSNAQVKLITWNPEAWFARWYMLESAKKSIDTTYFILDPDIFGMSFLGALLKKAKEGVKIRLMVDGSGVKGYARSFLGQDYLQELMQYENVQIRVFNPYLKNIAKLFTSVKQFISSNHDKIIVVDGELAMTGGRNIAHHYFADPDDDSTVYRDTDVLMKGKNVAAQLDLAFSEEFERGRNWQIGKEWFGNWKERGTELEIARRVMVAHLNGLDFTAIYEEFKNSEEFIDKYAEEAKACPRNIGFADYVPFPSDRIVPVKILDKNSANDERNDITFNLMNFMDSCKKEIIIQNPYVVMTERCRAAILRASRRGVKIIIVSNSPMSSDSYLTQAMFLLDWKKLLRDAPNCEIWAMKGPNKLHAKTFVFDRKATVIGTYNMDPMSETINSEVVAVVNDEEFASNHADVIHKDMENAFNYQIEIGPKGEILEKFGPSSHSDPAAIKRLEFMSAAKLIRPII